MNMPVNGQTAKCVRLDHRLALFLLPQAADRPAGAAPPADKVLLAPHRAVYDLTLSKSRGDRGIQAVRGRILYDLPAMLARATNCDSASVGTRFRRGQGHAQRFGANTWEDGAAEKFRFNSENLLDDKRTDAVNGHAERNAKTVAVNLSKRRKRHSTFGRRRVFRPSNMRRIIAADREGKTILEFLSMTARKPARNSTIR